MPPRRKSSYPLRPSLRDLLDEPTDHDRVSASFRRRSNCLCWSREPIRGTWNFTLIGPGTGDCAVRKLCRQETVPSGKLCRQGAMLARLRCQQGNWGPPDIRAGRASLPARHLCPQGHLTAQFPPACPPASRGQVGLKFHAGRATPPAQFLTAQFQPASPPASSVCLAVMQPKNAG